jgi:two-component system sensor histidine kinase MprB
MTAVTTRVRRISFRTRLQVFIAAAVGVTVALASLAAYFTVHHQLLSQVDSSLVSEASSAPAEPGGTFVPDRVAPFLQRYADSVLQVIDAQGQVRDSYAPGGPLPVTAAQASIVNSSTSRQYSIETVRYSGVPYRVITESGFADQTGTALAIQIARPLSDIDHTLSDLRLILWLVTLAGIAVSIGVGYLIGRATIRPVERLTAAAEHVAATQDLAATIEEQGDDELARLAHSFNSMLAALAASRQQQAQLISDAGHELRTPITSLRTNIEVLMRAPELPENDRRELVADVQAQLEELSTLIGDVVELAREDERRDATIEVRFDAIVEHAVERARRRAPSIRFDTRVVPGMIRAQPALLERAVLNVLDNAVKWSPPDGTVRLSMERSDRWVLEVRDQGPGVGPQDLPHVFDRFYRAETARSMPGSGLGLAIVRQVINEHGGFVAAVSPEDGGTLVHVELPIVLETEPEPAPNSSDSPANGSKPEAAHDYITP